LLGEFEDSGAAMMSSGFRAVVADLGLSDRDEALKAAWRIIELAGQGEREPERPKVSSVVGERTQSKTRSA
jgi:hypothetical protein